MISRVKLEKLYVAQKLSMKEISDQLDCSVNQVSYWMKKYEIKSRTISEGVYVKCNPSGDPFKFHKPLTIPDAVLYGLGIGIYWGEGNKANQHSIRLGNTDPQLIKLFINFLERIYQIDKSRLQFGLQIFSDISPDVALEFWQELLHAEPKQFFKVTVTKPRGLGTYRRKIKHGVLTVYFNNKKLRDIICGEIEKL